jgi:uncharacterized membrane protein
MSGGLKAAVSGGNAAGGALKGAFSGVKDKIKEKLPGGGAKKSAKKFSNIVDSFDVGVPVRVAYNQWTQFGQWSEFMKKLEFAETKDEEGKVAFKAKIFIVHRRWESTIVDMVPDEHIVWQSVGDKGYLNGAVTFSELAHNLTRLSLVVEYHPQGFWENILNIWRTVGSRVRLETKLYIHHVMTSTQLDPEAVQGWRAEIHDKEIVRTHDEVVEQEQQEQEEREERERQEAEDRDREDAGYGDEADDQDGQDDDYDDEADDRDEESGEDRGEDDGYDDEADDEDDDYEDEADDGADEDDGGDEEEAPYDDEERAPVGAGAGGGRR